MKVLTIGWLSVFLGILLLNIYIWKCYMKIPFRRSRFLKAMSYFTVHISLAMISVIYFYLFFNGKTETRKSNILSYIAAFYLTFIHYSALMYLVHDLVYMTRNIFSYPEGLKVFVEKLFFGGFIIFGIAAIISMLGILNSREVFIRNYEIVKPQKESIIEELNIVYISDGHIGTSLNRRNMDKLIENINILNPDIVFLGGDFFDEGTTEDTKKLFANSLNNIKSKYGVFVVEGNHEYKSGNSKIDEEMDYLANENVRVLQDEIIEIKDSFYIIGRKDRHGKDMIKLSDLTDKLNKNLPVIVLDHRPSFSESGYIDKVDLQLSGHTHSGQFFPLHIINFIGSKISKQFIYGHHSINNLDLIVSSGVGDWGIPVRVGSKREILNIKLRLK